jgi:sugar/nucleoside kinase (ribokinase family)
MENKPQLDFIAIGDTVIDAFIRLSVGHIQETAHGREICLPYGMKVPFDDVFVLPAVGNSANASVSASRLGLTSALITSLGKDQHGDECLTQLTKEGISTNYVRQEEGKKTNYHYVLWKEDDRTILIKHEQFTPVMPDVGSPKWLYLSSLGGHTLPFHHELISYVKDHPEIKLAFQPGTYQLAFGVELAELYKITEVVCMNKEEAEQLLASEGSPVKDLLDGLSAMGPKTIIVTDGPHGAYMKYDNTYFSMPLYPDIAAPLERTGAGDAFFSTFIAYLAKGYDAPYAMRRAPINSMNVVQHVGAQEGLLTEQALEEYLKKAPTDYVLSIMK